MYGMVHKLLRKLLMLLLLKCNICETKKYEIMLPWINKSKDHNNRINEGKPEIIKELLSKSTKVDLRVQ